MCQANQTTFIIILVIGGIAFLGIYLGIYFNSNASVTVDITERTIEVTEMGIHGATEFFDENEHFEGTIRKITDVQAIEGNLAITPHITDKNYDLESHRVSESQTTARVAYSVSAVAAILIIGGLFLLIAYKWHVGKTNATNEQNSVIPDCHGHIGKGDSSSPSSLNIEPLV